MVTNSSSNSSDNNNNNNNSYLQAKFEGKRLFIQGNVACAYGALVAGCRFFAGYPITPSTEIAETMARELPYVDGFYIQMEDELAALAAVIGASWAGTKAMTVTSGPGFSLMQEHIGYAIMTETPCVIVDVQRSGPSTGQATKPAQGDIMQARWGTHGDHEIIALAPSSAQECFENIIECFNLAELYRNPVIFLMDGSIGHLREPVNIPSFAELKIIAREELGKTVKLPSGVTPMGKFGAGDALHITGSTHKEDGMRDVTTVEVHDRLVRRLCAKIRMNKDKLIKVEYDYDSDTTADDDNIKIGVIAYGAPARPARGAVLKARKYHGLKIDFLKLITIWPFPEQPVLELAERVDKLVIPEMNLGQLIYEVERVTKNLCELIHIPKIGGVPHTIDEIYQVLIKTANK